MESVRRKKVINNTPSNVRFKDRINNRYGPGFNLNIRKLENLYIKLAHVICSYNFLHTAKIYGVVPKGLQIKLPYDSYKAKAIINRTMRALLNERLNFQRFLKYKLIKEISDLQQFIGRILQPDDYSNILKSITNKHKNLMISISNKHKIKLNKLTNDDLKCHSNSLVDNQRKTVFNFSNVQLGETEISVLNKGLSFALNNKTSPLLDFISSVEYSIHNLPVEDQNEFRCRVNMALKKKSNNKSNITQAEWKAIKNLRENTELTIRKADKGGGIVLLNTVDYDDKMKDILNSDEYVPLNKDPTSNIERKVYKCLVNYKEFIPAKTRTQLTPHFSKYLTNMVYQKYIKRIFHSGP